MKEDNTHTVPIEHERAIAGTNVMTSEIMTITPEMAERMLRANTKNRNLRVQHVDKFVRLMKAGQWKAYVGTPIRFGTDGTLIDGQHRLHSVVKSGTSITVRVERNVPLDAREHEDGGALRTPGDVLTMLGYRNGRFLAGAANALHRYQTGGYAHAMSSNAGSVKLSHREIVEMVERNPLLVDSYQHTKDAYQEIRYSHAATAVAWVTLSELAGVEKATEFFDLITNLGSGNQPIVAMLKRIRDDREAKKTYTVGTVLYLLFRAWNAWVAGENISRFPLGSEGKWAPLPQPKKP